MASSRMRPVWIVIPPQSLRQLTSLSSQHHQLKPQPESGGAAARPSPPCGGEEVSGEKECRLGEGGPLGRGAESTSDLRPAPLTRDREEGSGEERGKEYIPHSDVEKRRKHRIVDSIQQLAALLQLKNRVGNLTRADILEVAVKRIKELVEDNAGLEKDISKLTADQPASNADNGEVGVANPEEVGMANAEEVGVADGEGTRSGREELERKLQGLVVEHVLLKQQILNYIASNCRGEGEESGGHMMEESCDDGERTLVEGTVDQDGSCDNMEESCDHQDDDNMDHSAPMEAETCSEQPSEIQRLVEATTCQPATPHQSVVTTSQPATSQRQVASTSQPATSQQSVVVTSQHVCSSALPPIPSHQPWPISSLLSAAEEMLEGDNDVITATPTSRGQSAAAVRTIRDSSSESTTPTATPPQVTAPQIAPLQVTTPQVTSLQVTSPQAIAVPQVRGSETLSSRIQVSQAPEATRAQTSMPEGGSFPGNPIVQPWVGRSCPQPHPPHDHTHIHSQHHHHPHQYHPYLHRQHYGSPYQHQAMYPHSSNRHHVTISHHSNPYSRTHPFHPPQEVPTQHSSLPHPLQQSYGSHTHQESFGMQPYPTGPSYHPHIPATAGTRTDAGRFPGYHSTAPRGRSYHHPQHQHHHGGDHPYTMLPPPHNHHMVSCDSMATHPYPPMLGPPPPGQGPTHNTVWRPYSEPHRSTGFYLSDILGDPGAPSLTEHQSLQLEPTPPTTTHRMASFFVDRLLDDSIM